MTKYGIDDVSWNSYEFADFTWENMTEQSSAKNNMILFNATRTEEEIWNQNGSLTFKVKPFFSFQKNWKSYQSHSALDKKG